ncbi:hypothetical protein MC378_12015 [Polaribacter sp. MSW13]|uniref:Uncharacterized protein n=1 Tax=Polaribacter marinus TaxID=2916838 RepID=A0A9X1VNP4_9FLAO|nr:hypothetical protein [Polaribacter marinus]MCI2229894.1 hypothetical protein [Polaribacter marinus]
MKNTIKTFGIAILFLATTINFYSQDIAMTTSERDTQVTYSSDTVITNTALKEGTYTYRLGSNDVIVSIKGDYYTEYYPNNEFIKAKINWTSEDEYTLTIVDLKKKNIPFKAGTTLNTKITKVKGNKYYYKSDLQDLSWTGKFKKVDDDLLEE